MLATLSLVDRHMPLQAGGRPYIGMDQTINKKSDLMKVAHLD